MRLIPHAMHVYIPDLEFTLCSRIVTVDVEGTEPPSPSGTYCSGRPASGGARGAATGAGGGDGIAGGILGASSSGGGGASAGGASAGGARSGGLGACDSGGGAT